MSQGREPVAQVAPQASLRLAWSERQGQDVIVVDGGLTFDMGAGRFKIQCDTNDPQIFYIEIEAIRVNKSDPIGSLILVLSPANIEQLIHEINNARAVAGLS